MTFRAIKIISGAYYASGVVARQFEQVSDAEKSDALTWLNDIVMESSGDLGMIPYVTQQTFTGAQGQEEYEVEGLVNIDTLTFVKDTVRYPMTYVKRDKYQGEGRALDINSLPYQYYFERNKSGSTVYLYFNPDEAYVFTITGKFALSEIVINTDLESVFERYYITYLRYALAQRICIEYGEAVPPGVQEMVDKYQDMIDKQSAAVDFRLRKVSTLQDEPNFNWAWANLYRGYLP